MDKENEMSSDESRGVEDWRNEHGLPDFKYLQSLVIDGGAEAVEKLRSIAEDVDAEYDPEASPEELIQAIRFATERNEDQEPIVTT